ncbi:MAG TPA: acetate--CoA ligase family protein [Longimicrobiales bacterium]|nr:acetate--CoA ligase family protein [Longimicrobiales bacterium]
MSSRTSSGPRVARPAAQRGHPLDAVLRPESVAIIGASPDPTKRGHRAVRALLTSNFRGRVIPMHPSGGELDGLPVARGAAGLEAVPDLVLVCTPAATVPAVLAEWARAGARGAVVLASGFGEAGAAGAELEDRIRDVVADTGMRVVGPNTSGILNVPLGLNLIGVDGVVPGSISLLVQSGNLALALMTEAAQSGLGFSFVIGVGNEVDVGFHEYLDFLAADERTRAVLVHAEGFRHGAAFLAAARRIAQVKPVVVLKGARTARGGMTARSHTGAVAGSYDALRAGLRQAGVIEVQRSDELLPVVSTLLDQARSSDLRGVAILSDGGGHATIAVDDLHDRGVRPASLAADTLAGLRALLGPAAAIDNPIDIAGAADRDPLAFARTLELLAGDAAIDIVLLVGLFGGYAIRFSESLLDAELEAARRLPEIARAAGVGLVVHSLYARSGSEPLRLLQRAGVPVIESLEAACRSVHALLEQSAGCERSARLPGSWPAAIGDARPHVPAGVPPEPFARARAEQRGVLLETEARPLVAAFGVPLVPAALCRTPDDVAAAAATATTAVAIRVVSPSAPHKTEAGGVALGVAPGRARAEAERVFAAVQSWCAAHGRTADIPGALVSPMLGAPIAELLVGVIADPQFGPVLTVGAGGTRVELQRDVATRVLPVGEREVDDMLASLRIAPILAGHRGAAGADLAAIREAVLGIARCALALPEIAEIEVNPLFVYADRAVALDVRVFIA